MPLVTTAVVCFRQVDQQPLLQGCGCYACTNFTRAYVHHLHMTHEMLGTVLLTLFVLTSHFFRRTSLNTHTHTHWQTEMGTHTPTHTNTHTNTHTHQHTHACTPSLFNLTPSQLHFLAFSSLSSTRSQHSAAPLTTTARGCAGGDVQVLPARLVGLQQPVHHARPPLALPRRQQRRPLHQTHRPAHVVLPHVPARPVALSHTAFAAAHGPTQRFAHAPP